MEEKVDLIALGVHQKFLNKRFNFLQSSNQVSVEQWVSSHNNMGFTITRQLWQKILACKRHFCTYDDYNWDWSLHHVSVACLPKPLKVLTTKAPVSGPKHRWRQRLLELNKTREGHEVSWLHLNLR